MTEWVGRWDDGLAEEYTTSITLCDCSTLLPVVKTIDTRTAAVSRQHSVMNGCFQEAKPQGQLFGDESERMHVEPDPGPPLAL